MNRLDRITTHPDVCLGQPTIRGMRITVAFIVKMVERRYSAEEILSWYPTVEKDDILQAVEYAETHPCEA